MDCCYVDGYQTRAHRITNFFLHSLQKFVYRLSNALYAWRFISFSTFFVFAFIRFFSISILIHFFCNLFFFWVACWRGCSESIKNLFNRITYPVSLPLRNTKIVTRCALWCFKWTLICWNAQESNFVDALLKQIREFWYFRAIRVQNSMRKRRCEME